MLKKIIRILFFWTIFLGAPLHSFPTREKKYTLSACAIFRNEGKYLKEWIEYHRLIGVDHFYLYNNNSVDRSNRILRSYVKEGIVTLTHWPDCLGHLPENKMYIWSLSTQTSAYQHAISLRKHETKWLVLMDIDEFLVPMEESSIQDMLVKCDAYPGIILEKEYFDASDIITLPKKKLVIEFNELMKNPKENIQKEVEKIIFRPELCQQFVWPPFKCVFKKDLKALSVPKKKLRIHRYVNRDKGHSLKASRGKVSLDPRSLSDGEKKQLLEGGFEIEDRSMLRYVPDLLKKMGYAE